MAAINSIIPQQNFEIIRDQISIILGLELTNQNALDSTYIVPGIAIERVVPIDDTEIAYINICLSKASYESQTPRLQHGNYTYYIDVYANSPANDGKTGDMIAKTIVQRTIGKCRSILQNPAYNTLGFVPNTIPGGYAGIENVSVSGFVMTDNVYTPDALANILGRIILQVKCVEGTPLISGNLFEGGDTTITINNGPYGYQLEISGS